MEVQGFSCPFSGFCEGLRAFSILFCSSLVFHWYPRLEGPLFVTLFRVLLGQLARGAYMHHCMMAFRRQGMCANFFASPIHFFTTHGKFVSSGLDESFDFLWPYGSICFSSLWKRGGPCISLYTVWLIRYWTKPRLLTGGVLCKW